MKNKIFGFLILTMIISAAAYSQQKTAFTLEEIIQMGLKYNLSVSAKHKQAEALKAAYQASKALRNPEIDLHMGKAASYDKLEKRNTQGIAVTQPLENPFKRHYRIQMNKNVWQAAEDSHAFSRLETSHSVKVLYFEILLLNNQQELAQKKLESIREIYQLIQKKAQLGEVKELEAIKLHVETLKSQKEFNAIQTEIRLAKEKLNNLLGNSLPHEFALSGNLEYSPFLEEKTALLEKALASHPRIKEKESQLEEAANYLSFIKWHRFPDFSLKGFAQDELDGKNRGFGISLDIPLWNFRSKEIASAENLSLKQHAELKAVKMALSTEIKAQWDRVKLDEQTLQIFITGLLKQAEASLWISEISYKEGEISLIDYLDSQRTYYSIHEDYYQALFTWNADKAALEKAVGETL